MSNFYFIIFIIFNICCYSYATELHSELKMSKNIYSPIGKRDPFKRVLEKEYVRMISSFKPDERFTLDQLSLKAILHDDKGKVAMFEDPEGGILILREGDRIGRQRATVSRILKKDVIITEHTTNYLGIEGLVERVVSLPKDELSGNFNYELPKNELSGNFNDEPSKKISNEVDNEKNIENP